MSGARAAILGAIRRATARMPPGEAAPPAYRRDLDLPPAALLERFAERLTDYDLTVLRAPEGGIAAATTQLAERGIRTLLIPTDLPETWRPSGPTLVLDSGQPPCWTPARARDGGP